ncbi:38116_t:CDS:2, partial [Gigaspora margarita]
EIDLDTMDDISVFNLEEVSDKDKEFEQIRSLAAITNLVEYIKNIMSKLFERYYKFDNDKILFLTTAIDPRCKNFKYEGAILKGQDYLRVEYDQIISNEGLGLLSSKAVIDKPELFISTVFIAVQQNATHKNEIDQYLKMEIIGPLDNPLQWWQIIKIHFQKQQVLHKNVLKFY